MTPCFPASAWVLAAIPGCGRDVGQSAAEQAKNNQLVDRFRADKKTRTSVRAMKRSGTREGAAGTLPLHLDWPPIY